MIELRRGVAFEKRQIRRRRPIVARKPLTVHRRPGVVDESGFEARNERSENDLQNHRCDDDRTHAPDQRRDGTRRAPRHIRPFFKRQPNQKPKNCERRREMQRQPVLTDVDAFNETGFHHVPADDALHAAKSKNAKKLRAAAALQTAGQPEEDQRHRKRDADNPSQKAMAPFPPVDRLKLGKRHAVVHDVILRDLLILLEGREPIGVAQRRNGAEQRLPFRDRKAALGQTRRTADHDHRDDERRDGPEPDRDGAVPVRMSS